jgi:signal transduction histidine kinase
MKFIYFIFLFIINSLVTNAQNWILIDDSLNEINLANKVSYFKDSTNKLTDSVLLNEVNFIESKNEFLNFKITKSTIWLKIVFKNTQSKILKNYLCIDQLNINKLELFKVENNSLIKVDRTFGTDFNIINKKFPVSGFTFKINLNPNDSSIYYIKVSTKGQLFIPLFIRNYETYNNLWFNRFLFFGIYVGIIAALLFYNLFLAISIYDERKTYIWYLFHTLFILLTQSSLQGFSNLFLWSNNHFMANQSVNLFTCLVSISGIEYAKSFLHLKVTKNYIIKFLYLYQIIYLVIFFISILGYVDVAYTIIQPVQLSIAILMITLSSNLVFKGNRLALFYLISWFTLFVGIIIFILTDLQILPYNLFTSQILLYGSALQVILLSIAQADKYNILKLEEQKAQEKALSIANLNERIIREQNVVLEEKVNLRTVELSNTNIQLNEALISLKDAQMQLIEKEKMSSLGQLTAGIAHEINNPINFVTGNIKPLKRDVLMVIDLLNNFEDVAKSSLTVEEKTAKLKMLKLDLDFDYLNEEINFLLKGIEEGASRTAEIVKGLKIFSRTDEFETKIANVNDGLNSTLVLLNNLISTKIKVIKEFDNENAVIEHFPGKLNQVFMNILSNSIFAINQKWVNETGGVINIKTENIDGRFVISFTDNGIGMSEDVLNRIYEPFYTTKPVGAGTGLGMSIVYKTIELHKGKITIDSKLNQGTTIKIEIPNKLII